MIIIIETNSMCLPDRTNGSCEWKLFGWNPYHGCGYNQQISSSCMNFYGKNSLNTKNQSRLFSSFCFPKQQLELFWYSFTVQLPENVTMINVVTDTNGIASNHSLIIKDLSIQQCHRITTLPISLPMNTTILSSRLNRKKTFWIQYRWILIIGTLVVLFTSLIIVITINLYISDRIFHQEPTVTERKQITSMNLSQHFYEEPVSIVLTPPIDISVYDHVRDNYRVDILFSFKTKKSSFATMSSTITDGDNHRKQDKYESIFKHYGFQMRAQHLDHQNEKNNIEINSDLNKYKRILHDIKTRFLQRNESNKKEKKTRTITSKTQQAISKSSPTKSKRKKDSKKEILIKSLIIYSAEASDDYLSKYSQRRTHCLDLFEEYVNGLKRPFGIIRDAASDPPVFDPGLTIMGPRVKKDASVIDKEEFQAIKMINSIEPRKKYALVHEQIGIFVIGGYNLFVRIPEQQEPDKDYLFKSDGSIVRISRLSPCRVHFGVYTDGDAIYVAGGQKINNELLDDIQRLNLRTLKWEYVATLLNPIAASAMTVDEQRIYIDILKWTQEAPAWVKISQTPELSKLHALSFNDPFLEVTKRNLSDEHGTSETIAEAYYDFRTNLWANGSASAKTIPLTKQEHSSSAAKISDKSASRTTKTKKVTVAKTSSKSNPISKTKSTSKSKVCQHRPYECIQVSYRGIRKCITNFNRLTTVSHVIDALLDDLSERRYLSANDCCLYIERQPYLFPLKSTDFIQDILLRYTATHVHFKLSFKRNSSPSRFAQRKRLLRTAGYIQPSPVINAYEQLKIQESLIRRQHEMITQLRKTNLSNDSRIQQNGASNYGNYLDWITQNEHNGDMSDDSKTSLDLMSTSRRHSRQDEYLKAVNQETVNSSRSLSRVRFRPSTIINTDEISTSLTQVKSILKKGATNYSHIPRTSSVDRDINRLISTKQRRNSLYTFDDADDDNLTDRSTTDSCLGSLSSDDNNSYVINQQQLETLV
ncbi:unnamed protein product [Rotaria magnacalcarata]|uniref:Uncharacterized protein n=1 Tax=Rotaria magnacalcarata TaxID=392030 RepID=A0A8S2IUW5_9BILA|nr:unnamed protein product [Rotaria magnacalcarata]